MHPTRNDPETGTAPWTRAEPETPLIILAAPFASLPSGTEGNGGKGGTPQVPPEHGATQAQSAFPKSPLALLADPFGWKLSDASAALTRPLTPDRKRTALAELPRGPFAAVGCYVSTPREVEILAEAAASRRTTPLQEGGHPTFFAYVPGEVCRQADVLEAVRAAGLPVALERGPFLPPSDVVRAVEKLEGCQRLLVDAGGVNGYADRILDPRALWILKETNLRFGIHVGELLEPAGAMYEWKPKWIRDPRFVTPLVGTARALGASAYVLPAENPALAALAANALHRKN
jgi:hypothetical protein